MCAQSLKRRDSAYVAVYDIVAAMTPLQSRVLLTRSCATKLCSRTSHHDIAITAVTYLVYNFIDISVLFSYKQSFCS